MDYVINIPTEPALLLFQYAAMTGQTPEDVLAQAIRHYLEKEADYAG